MIEFGRYINDLIYRNLSEGVKYPDGWTLGSYNLRDVDSENNSYGSYYSDDKSNPGDASSSKNSGSSENQSKSGEDLIDVSTVDSSKYIPDSGVEFLPADYREAIVDSIFLPFDMFLFETKFNTWNNQSKEITINDGPEVYIAMDPRCVFSNFEIEHRFSDPKNKELRAVDKDNGSNKTTFEEKYGAEAGLRINIIEYISVFPGWEKKTHGTVRDEFKDNEFPTDDEMACLANKKIPLYVRFMEYSDDFKNVDIMNIDRPLRISEVENIIKRQRAAYEKGYHIFKERVLRNLFDYANEKCNMNYDERLLEMSFNKIDWYKEKILDKIQENFYEIERRMALYRVSSHGSDKIKNDINGYYYFKRYTHGGRSSTRTANELQEKTYAKTMFKRCYKLFFDNIRLAEKVQRRSEISTWDMVRALRNSNLTSSSSYIKFSRAILGKRHLSPGNVLLSYFQKPDATCLLSQGDWKTLGMEIKPGAFPVFVSAPSYDKWKIDSPVKRRGYPRWKKEEENKHISSFDGASNIHSVFDLINVLGRDKRYTENNNSYTLCPLFDVSDVKVSDKLDGEKRKVSENLLNMILSDSNYGTEKFSNINKSIGGGITIARDTAVILEIALNIVLQDISNGGYRLSVKDAANSFIDSNLGRGFISDRRKVTKENINKRRFPMLRYMMIAIVNYYVSRSNILNDILYSKDIDYKSMRDFDNNSPWGPSDETYTTDLSKRDVVDVLSWFLCDYYGLISRSKLKEYMNAKEKEKIILDNIEFIFSKRVSSHGRSFNYDMYGNGSSYSLDVRNRAVVSLVSIISKITNAIDSAMNDVTGNPDMWRDDFGTINDTYNESDYFRNNGNEKRTIADNVAKNDGSLEKAYAIYNSFFTGSKSKNNANHVGNNVGKSHVKTNEEYTYYDFDVDSVLYNGTHGLLESTSRKDFEDAINRVKRRFIQKGDEGDNHESLYDEIVDDMMDSDE